MKKDSGQVVQAVPLIIGKMNVGVGNYKANSLIHCETAGSITLYDGTTTYAFAAGSDRGYSGAFTVNSGTFTFD